MHARSGDAHLRAFICDSVPPPRAPPACATPPRHPLSTLCAPTRDENRTPHIDSEEPKKREAAPALQAAAAGVARERKLINRQPARPPASLALIPHNTGGVAHPAACIRRASARGISRHQAAPRPYLCEVPRLILQPSAAAAARAAEERLLRARWPCRDSDMVTRL